MYVPNLVILANFEAYKFLIFRDVTRSENLGGRVVTWGPKIEEGGGA